PFEAEAGHRDDTGGSIEPAPRRAARNRLRAPVGPSPLSVKAPQPLAAPRQPGLDCRCRDSLHRGDLFDRVVLDLEEHHRFPLFGAQSLERPCRSLRLLRLFVPRRAVLALRLAAGGDHLVQRDEAPPEPEATPASM